MKYVYAFLALLALVVPASQAQVTPTTVLVSWVAPTKFVDGTPITAPITYQFYVGTSGKEVKSGTPVSGLALNIAVPPPGTQVCVQLTAIVNGVESDRTPEACAVMPYPQPTSPTVVTITIK